MADAVTASQELIEATKKAIMLQAEHLIPDEILSSGKLDEFLDHTANVQAQSQAYILFQSDIIHKRSIGV